VSTRFARCLATGHDRLTPVEFELTFTTAVNQPCSGSHPLVRFSGFRGQSHRQTNQPTDIPKTRP
jgi:hypothetical protein